jgi:hypothetical protein
MRQAAVTTLAARHHFRRAAHKGSASGSQEKKLIEEEVHNHTRCQIKVDELRSDRLRENSAYALALRCRQSDMRRVARISSRARVKHHHHDAGDMLASDSKHKKP